MESLYLVGGSRDPTDGVVTHLHCASHTGESDLGFVGGAIETERITSLPTRRTLPWGFFFFLVTNIMMLFRRGHVSQKGFFLFYFLPQNNERKLGRAWFSVQSEREKEDRHSTETEFK